MCGGWYGAIGITLRSFCGGVRINESRDNHDFYVKTNAMAHKLDTTRQTGGIRYFQESEFLEDVFTMNDFGFSAAAA